MPTALIDRARAYVAKMPPAISGQDGHGATFAVARVLVHFFSLPLEDARTVLTEYNGRCTPPWSAKELNHKLHSALKSKWEGPRACDQSPTVGLSSGQSRTLRKGFSNFVLRADSQKGQSRTLRTGFLDSFVMRAGAHAHGAQTASAENLSEVSEPPSAPEPGKEINIPAASWRAAKLVRGEDFCTKYTRWVARDGTVYHAHVAEVDGVHRMRIGRRMVEGEANQ